MNSVTMLTSILMIPNKGAKPKNNSAPFLLFFVLFTSL